MKLLKKLSILAPLLVGPAIILLSCNPSPKNKTMSDAIPAINDPHSFAKPELAVAEHLDLDIKVDFEHQQVSGRASWKINNKAKGKEIIFDNSGLNISKITLGEGGNGNGSEEQETTFTTDKDVKYL